MRDDDYRPQTKKEAAVTGAFLILALLVYGFLGYLIEVRAW